MRSRLIHPAALPRCVQAMLWKVVEYTNNTRQACNFRDGYKDFEDLGFKVRTTFP